MKIIAVIFAFIIVGFTFHQSLAQTSEQLVISTAKKLEEKPFDKEVLKLRKKAIKWIFQNHKFHLKCSISGNYLPSSYKFRSDLFAVFIMGTVAFYLENPNKPEDEDAAKNAGLISMIKTYEQMTKFKPKSKLEKLDKLSTAFRNNSNLARLLNCPDF